MRTFSSCSTVVLTRSARSSSLSAWAAASVSCVTGAVIISTQDSVSVTMSCPNIWHMSVVNYEIKSRWLNWRGEHLSHFWWKAKASGLWSVRMVKCRASST